MGDKAIILETSADKQAFVLGLMDRKKKELTDAERRALRSLLRSGGLGNMRILNLPEVAVDALLEGPSGGSDLTKEVFLAQYEERRNDLAGPGAPPVLAMLAESAALAWLHYSLVEHSYATVMRDSISLERADWWIRRLNAAQRRYLRAVETLARVSRLIRFVPAVQVNIAAEGGQQVNVAGDVVAGSDSKAQK